MRTQKMHTTLVLTLDGFNLSPLVPLLQKGFQVKVQVGQSVRHLLCEQCHVEPQILAERVQTLFLDGKVVDDVNTTTVKEGSIMALSSAMPGLAGATLRTGGLLAAFRDGITHEEKDAAGVPLNTGLVTIKLFNLLIRELGPTFLKKGIWVSRGDAEGLLKAWRDSLQPSVRFAEKDGREISPEVLKAMDWSREPEHVVLKLL